ncbi:hypothetical protein HYS11_01055 [Candidatus Gottesmanbacteria bacterium]|nr:hypothetical protein [Candidatus Gottesmanbacteria bacterium]
MSNPTISFQFNPDEVTIGKMERQGQFLVYRVTGKSDDRFYARVWHEGDESKGHILEVSGEYYKSSDDKHPQNGSVDVSHGQERVIQFEGEQKIIISHGIERR